MTDENILSNTNFQEYLEKLDKIKIPRTCVMQDYKQSEGNRRRTIKYYYDCIKKYPLRDIGRTEDKILSIRKTKKVEMTISYLSPLIMCAGESAGELAITANDDTLILSVLLQLIIVDKMSEDFKDSTIEKALIWYLMNYRKHDLRNIKRNKNGVLDSSNPYAVERIRDFALASTLYEKYKKDRLCVLSNISKIIVDQKGADSLLRCYEVDINNPEIIDTLEKQEKLLTIKRPS